MIDIDKERVATVILNAELIMYGFLAVQISRIEGVTVVSWLGVADGGQVVADEQKEYPDLEWSTFIDSISKIDAPEEDDTLSIVWNLQLGDENEDLLYEFESGLWDRDLLEQIVNIMEEYLCDKEPLEIFRNLFGWA